MQTPTIDLDRIAAARGGIIILNAVQHTVKAASATTLQLMRTAHPADYIPVSLVVVGRCVPSLDEAARNELLTDQIEAIIAIATGDIDAVAKLDPNGVGPATDPASPV